LVARYYCLCAKYQLVDEFGAIGYLPHITAMAGDLLGSDPESPKEDNKYILPASLIEATRLRARDEANLFYVCNALALATWNRRRCTVNAEGLQALVDCLEIPAIQAPANAPSREQLARVTPVQRCFILNGLVIRALEAAGQGGEAGTHLARLGGVALSGTKLTSDPVFAHLCWCYLQTLACRGIEVPTTDCPSLTGQEADTGTLAAVVYEPDARKRRSLQLALVQLIRLAPRNPDRLIATVHYLYILVIIFRTPRAWISETERLLRDVFAQGSVYRKLYETMANPAGVTDTGQSTRLAGVTDTAHSVALALELADLFRTCQSLFDLLDDRRQKQYVPLTRLG
jgi:hypothetical protein